MTAYTKNTPGAPTGGKYIVDDTCVDSEGRTWTCAISGFPGEWVSAGGQENANSTLFSQQVGVTIANNAAELTLLGAGAGSLVLPANFWTVGKALQIIAGGFLSEGGIETLNLKLKLGATVFAESGAVALGAGTNTVWTMNLLLICRAIGITGSIRAIGVIGTTSTLNGADLQKTTALDTTLPQTLDFTAQWGAADPGNTITCDSFIVVSL